MWLKCARLAAGLIPRGTFAGVIPSGHPASSGNAPACRQLSPAANPGGIRRGRAGPPGPPSAGQAVGVRSASARSSSPTDTSRILNFCTFPVTVIGKSLVMRR